MQNLNVESTFVHVQNNQIYLRERIRTQDAGRVEDETERFSHLQPLLGAQQKENTLDINTVTAFASRSVYMQTRETCIVKKTSSN